MKSPRDNLERRCPRLGGPVTFYYCRTTGEESLPCWKLLDCWWEQFDVLAYVSAAYPPDTVEKLIRARPKPKVTSLIELIAAAKKRSGQKS